MTPRPHLRHARAVDALTLALFLVIVLGPSIDAALRPSRMAKIRGEMRLPVQFPVWSFESTELARWPRRFEAWHNDYLGTRDVLLETRNALLLFGFGVSPTREMIVGEDQWLFPTDRSTVEILRGVKPFSMAEMAAWQRSLESRRDWCAARGIEYACVLVPDKQSIYPERLGDTFEPLGPTRLNQLSRYLSTHSTVRFFDATAALLAEKQKDQGSDTVYYKLGTHWTDRGVRAGYCALAEFLRGFVPGIEPLAPQEFPIRRSDELGDSWAARFYLFDHLRQEVWQLSGMPPRPFEFRDSRSAGQEFVVTEHANRTLPRLFVFHDSYGEPLRDYLPYHFSHCTFDWNPYFDQKLIQAADPDVLLDIYCERSWFCRSVTASVAGEREASASAFETSVDVRLALDAVLEPQQFEAQNGLRMTPAGDGIALEFRRPLELLVLPAFEFPKDADLAFALDATSAADATIDLVFKTRSLPRYSRANRVSFALPAGRSRIIVPLTEPSLEGRVALRFFGGTGRFVLHSIEVRAIPR